LLDLYQEHLEGTLNTQPGVRAIILYPMNALAYDQRDRLGRLYSHLTQSGSAFRFSYGQYTGATPEDKSDNYRHAADVLARRFPGELVFRNEMRTTPPHILLTNYSMLEYQLLRPDDSPLFDGQNARTWKFIVLDEAHQYKSTRGAEMSFLLRRLKQRLRRNGNIQRFRCIATSASLTGDDSDRDAVASFASTLFDEPFAASDVILAKTEQLVATSETKLDPDGYESICSAVSADDAAKLPSGVRPESIQSVQVLDTAVLAGQILARDGRVHLLQEFVQKGTKDLRELAEVIFPEIDKDKRVSALTCFINALSCAREPTSGGPFLSARYHVFLRALEGAFIEFAPVPQVTLAPKTSKASGGLSFELALCRECGQHYLVGRNVDGFFCEAVRDPSRDDFGTSFFFPRPNQQEDDADTESPTAKRKIFNLCVDCGALSALGAPYKCDHASRIVVEEQPSAEAHTDQLQQCARCGHRGQDPVREVVHGGDGPHSVIATGLFEHMEQKPKKILAFADSRQEAAYFAWYLDDTYRSVLRKNLLYQSLCILWDREHEAITLSEIADAYRRKCVAEGHFEETLGTQEQRRRSWTHAFQEYLSEETRLSLSGVGLLQWMIRWPTDFAPPACLLTDPWCLSREDSLSLTFMLLDQLRRDRAVELDTREEAELDWTDLELFGAQRIVRVGPPGGQTQIVSWNGRQGWRAQLLAKILVRRGHRREDALEIADQTLRSIWDHVIGFSDKQRAGSQLLRRVNSGRRLNPVWWRARPVEPPDTLYRCEVCNRIESVSCEGICTRRGCTGNLEPIKAAALEENHYRTLYRERLAGDLVVEEHTAQLSTDRAREVQRDFQNGRINVLSCSTTFELGVDLGDLNTVFLRNVPPEPFNYAQRVGRVGRRAGLPGFAVTYCRRGPHDLYHFADPTRLLSGRTKPPSLSLKNERVAERHLAAVALSAFFRNQPERFKKVEDLIGDWSEPNFAASVRRFVAATNEDLEHDLSSIFPPELAEKLNINSSTWIEDVCGAESRLTLAQLDVVADYKRADELEASARQSAQYDTARWAQRRKRTIADEDALSFLSRKAIIPKYGFPVDVVELDTQRSGTRDAFAVNLSRDLSIAIGEFAPTATLVAGKYEWQSYGLKMVPEKAWERKKYRVCHRHNLMVAWADGDKAPELACGDIVAEKTYVVPAFGFVTTNKAPKRPTRRPARMFTTRPYFLDSAGVDRGQLTIDGTEGPVATIRRAIPGRMAILSEGKRSRQFYICSSCGAGFLEPQASHRSPWSADCRGKLSRVSLGHEFVTDVVQVDLHLPPDASADHSGLALGLTTALLEGMAEVLDVTSTDLNGTIGRSGSSGLPWIVLYDAVPGGAGLVARMENTEIFKSSMKAAYFRVEGGCGCGEETSCYGCLRSYRNQFVHPHLKRGQVKAYLHSVLMHLGAGIR
jgi:hypothetical protein